MVRLTADERRQSILDAALRIFSRDGYDGATVAEIAGEARIAEALIYRHFSSKEALFQALIGEGDPQDGLLASIGSGSRPAHEALREFALKYFEYFDSDKNRMVFKLLTAEISRVPENTETARQTLVASRALVRVLGRYLGEQQKTGAVRPGPTHVQAQVVLGALYAFVQARHISRIEPQASMPLDQAARQVTDFLLGGLFLGKRLGQPAGDPRPLAAESDA